MMKQMIVHNQVEIHFDLIQKSNLPSSFFSVHNLRQEHQDEQWVFFSFWVNIMVSWRKILFYLIYDWQFNGTRAFDRWHFCFQKFSSLLPFKCNDLTLIFFAVSLSHAIIDKCQLSCHVVFLAECHPAIKQKMIILLNVLKPIDIYLFFYCK